MTETIAERRRRLVRDEIGAIAMDLFAERGFDEVTVDDIAAAVGTSARTVFRYFPAKDDIVLDFERRLQARLLAAFSTRPADEGPVRALRASFLLTSHVEDDQRARVLALGRVLAGAPGLRARALGQRVVADEALVDAVAARIAGPGADRIARTVVVAMNAVAGEAFLAWVVEGGRGDPAERIGAALTLIEDGLATIEDPTHPGGRRR